MRIATIRQWGKGLSNAIYSEPLYRWASPVDTHTKMLGIPGMHAVTETQLLTTCGS